VQQRYEQNQEIASDKQREDLLQIYLDRMSELLLDKHLRTTQPDAEERNVAHVRTITILIQLDARRSGYVFAFLREAGLQDVSQPIVSLHSTSQKAPSIHGGDEWLFLVWSVGGSGWYAGSRHARHASIALLAIFSNASFGSPTNISWYESSTRVLSLLDIHICISL
jgi:hypothetical protein